MLRNTDQVDQLLGELDLGSEAEKMLWDPRFWYEDVCMRLFERIDELVFTVPKEALPLAETVRDLVHLVPPEHCEGRRLRALAGKSYAVYGSALRSVGELQDAGIAYVVAELLLWEEGSALERADLWLRVAVLCTAHRSYSEAQDYVEAAVDNCQLWSTDDRVIGKAICVRGFVYGRMSRPEAALRDFGSAMQHLDPDLDRRLFLAALINFGYRLEEVAVSRETIDLAREKLNEARLISEYGEHTLVGVKLIWVDGKISLKLGEEAEAERVFRKVQDRLIELGTPYERAEIGVDLAELLFHQGRHNEAAEIAALVFPILHKLRIQPEIYKAMAIFYSAAIENALTQAIINRARLALQHRPAA